MANPPERGQVTRMASLLYPSKNLGHLNEEQTKSFEEFRQRCVDAKLYTIGDESTAPSHDDATLLRFLRARKFDVKGALDQFEQTEKWRKEHRVGEMYATIDVDEYVEAKRLFPSWTGRRDKRGVPIVYYRLSAVDSKMLSAYEKRVAKYTGPAKNSAIRIIPLFEEVLELIFPICSAMPDRPYPEAPITQGTDIIDVSKVGIKRFWDLKKYLQDAGDIANRYYPETEDRIFVVGAPSWFHTIWGWVKRFIDPITVAKIFVIPDSKVKATLEEYIDPRNIPTQYGGELHFDQGMSPVLESSLQEHLEWHIFKEQQGQKTFPDRPVRWIPAPPGEAFVAKLVALGSVDGKPIEEPVATVWADKFVNNTLQRAVTAERLVAGADKLFNGDVAPGQHPSRTTGEADHLPKESEGVSNGSAS